MTDRLDQSVSTAVNYLHAKQNLTGPFQVWSSVDPSLSQDTTAEDSVFATACVLYCLEWLQCPAAEQIRSKSLAFLRAESSARGLYQYFTSRSKAVVGGGSLTLPLVTLYDVDTTACVSALLRRYGTELDNQKILLANQDNAGFFQLWLMQEAPEEADSGFPFICFMPYQNRTCSGVSANALMYLGVSDSTYQAAEQLGQLFLRRAHCESSPYYPDEIVLFYLYSRAYFSGIQSLGNASQVILEQIRTHQKSDGSFGTPLQTALALCTLLNFGSAASEYSRAADFLLGTQAAEGSWERNTFYIGHDEDMRQEWHYGSLRRVYDHRCAKLYFGSEEITTAYCLEALSRYREAVL